MFQCFSSDGKEAATLCGPKNSFTEEACVRGPQSSYTSSLLCQFCTLLWSNVFSLFSEVKVKTLCLPKSRVPAGLPLAFVLGLFGELWSQSDEKTLKIPERSTGCAENDPLHGRWAAGVLWPRLGLSPPREMCPHPAPLLTPWSCHGMMGSKSRGSKSTVCWTRPTCSALSHSYYFICPHSNPCR